MATPHQRLNPVSTSTKPRLHRPQRPHPAVLSARVERAYVATVAFTLGAAGTAIGFTFGVIPYFHATNFGRYDGFFTACCAVGAVAGFIVGAIYGARWYRANEASPLAQRQMLHYLHRRGADARGVPQRTLNSAALRNLIGRGRTPVS